MVDYPAGVLKLPGGFVICMAQIIIVRLSSSAYIGNGFCYMVPVDGIYIIIGFKYEAGLGYVDYTYIVQTIYYIF